MAVLSQMTRFPDDIGRRYGELVSDAAKDGEAIFRKGSVQRKFEDYVFKSAALETMVGFNSGLKTGLYDKKAVLDLRDGMRSVGLQFDALARVAKMEDHSPVTLPSFQVVNKQLIFYMVAKVPGGDFLAIREMGVVDWSNKSLATALHAGQMFYASR